MTTRGREGALPGAGGDRRGPAEGPNTARERRDDRGDDLGRKVQEDARSAAKSARDSAKAKAEAELHSAAHEVDTFAEAIDSAAATLRDEDREGLARYARRFSDGLSRAAGRLEERSVDDLAGDVKRLARENPGLFMLGSIALGFGLSRFMKASAHHPTRDEATYDTGTGVDSYSDDYPPTTTGLGQSDPLPSSTTYSQSRQTP